MSKKQIAFVVVFFVLIVGFFLQKPQTPPDTSQDVPIKVLSVSDFPISLEGKPSVIVTLGKNKDDFVEFSILREQVRPGFFAVLPAQINIHPLNVAGGRSGKNYIISGKHETTASFAIDRIDPDKKTAYITVSARLIDSTELKNFVDISKTTASISGLNFDNFVKQIK